MDKLSTIKLADGRQAEILRSSVMPDDIPEEMRQWFANLGPWTWHLQQWHEGLVTDTEGKFYLVRLEGRLVGNVTIFSNGAFLNGLHP